MKLATISEVNCPSCWLVMLSGDETQFYEYQLVDQRDNSTIEEGTFTILHDYYIEEAQEYKYCIICNTIKPLICLTGIALGIGRQGECRLCKAVYNSIKNKTRLTDQHAKPRKAANVSRPICKYQNQQRRIYKRLVTVALSVGETYEKLTPKNARLTTPFLLSFCGP